MRRPPLAALCVLLVSGCAANSHPSEGTARTPSGVGMAPTSCAEVPFGTLSSDQQPIRATRPVTVGLHVAKGLGRYIIDDMRIEVLKPGTSVAQGKGQDDPILADSLPTILRAERTHVPAADQDFTLRFTGLDSAGTRLVAASYPVIFYLGSSPAPASGCLDSPAAEYGLLTTIEWGG